MELELHSRHIDRSKHLKMMDVFTDHLRGMGVEVQAFLNNNGDWSVKYFASYKAHGLKPKISDCRDEKDYELKYLAWKKSGTFYSEAYRDFEEMIQTEDDRLVREFTSRA